MKKTNSILNEGAVRELLSSYAREGRLMEAAPEIMMQVSHELKSIMKALNKVENLGLGIGGNVPPAPKPQKPFEFSEYTFLYECEDSSRNSRLIALFNALKQLEWIHSGTPQKQFIDLFSGENLYHRIRWTGTKQNLAYFFKLLINDKKYVRTTHARIWMTVRSHFVQHNGKPFEDDMKDQQIPVGRNQRLVVFLTELLNPNRTIPSMKDLLEG